MSQVRMTVQNEPAEWGYVSGKVYDDPFREVELDVVFSGAGGPWRVPAYWAGGNEWRVRFSPPVQGTYTFEAACSDEPTA